MTATDGIVLFTLVTCLISAPLWIIALATKSGAEALESMVTESAGNAIGFTAEQDADDEDDE